MTIYRNEKQDSKIKFRQHYGWVEVGLQVQGKEVYEVCCVFNFLNPSISLDHFFQSLPQLLEDMIGKDCNECYGSYRDRGVPNCKLIAS